MKEETKNWLLQAKEDLAEITRHFWRVRYPDFRKYMYTNKESVEPTVVNSRKIYLWVSQQLEQA